MVITLIVVVVLAVYAVATTYISLNIEKYRKEKLIG